MSSPPAAKQAQEEKQLQQKSAAYPYLWSEVLAAEASHRGLSFKASFLKLDDATATELDDSIRKQRLEEVRLLASRHEINAEICTVLADLIR